MWAVRFEGNHQSDLDSQAVSPDTRHFEAIRLSLSLSLFVFGNSHGYLPVRRWRVEPRDGIF